MTFYIRGSKSATNNRCKFALFFRLVLSIITDFPSFDFLSLGPGLSSNRLADLELDRLDSSPELLLEVILNEYFLQL